jgi:two-component system, LytTR family, response regulator
MKAIIVDDERLARVSMRKLLASHPEIEIAGEASSCEEAARLIRYNNPRLIFLDIQLGGETGFDLLEIISSSIKVIFVTAFDNYAIRAFEVNAIDYLLKPVNPERLKEAIGRVIRKDKEEVNERKIFKYTDNIFVRLNNSSSKFIRISSITHIESAGNYSKLYTAEGKHPLVLKTLKQWQEELPTENFVRIHRSTIVNLECVERFEKLSDSPRKAYLKNFSGPLEISRRYARKLRSMN